jgi:hypothetical protein
MSKFKVYKKSIDIDYYVYFTKAYFAFNAYLKEQHSKSTDTDKIREMKNDVNISRKFASLVEDDKHFRDNLIALKETLSLTEIKNKDKVITFDRVKIGDHSIVKIFDESYHGVPYLVESIGKNKFKFMVKNIKSAHFEIENLESELNSISISSTQKFKVKALIERHCESYNINLSERIERLKSFKNLDNTDKTKISEDLYKGFIEILYKLRNALFHSEVEPNADVMKVYKFTYFILRKIIYKIPN